MKAKQPNEYIVNIRKFYLNGDKPAENKKSDTTELVQILTKPNLCGKHPVVKASYDNSSFPHAYVFMIDPHYDNYINDYLYRLTFMEKGITVFQKYNKEYTEYRFSSEKCAKKFWETYIENNSHLLKTLYTLRFKKDYFKNVDKVKNINGMTFKTRWDMYRYLGKNYGVDSNDNWVFGHGYTPLIQKQLYLPFEDPKNEYEICEVFFTHEDTVKNIIT